MRNPARAVLMATVLALLGPGAPALADPRAGSDVVSTVQTAAKRTTTVTFTVNENVLRRGEQVWFSGVAKVSGKASAGRVVSLERRKPGTKTWSRFGLSTTSSSGYYSRTVRPYATFEYRAVVRGTTKDLARSSTTRRVALTTGPRSLSQRVESLGSRAGGPTSRVVTLTSTQRKAAASPGATKIRVQNRAKGTLVGITRSGAERTWFVNGKILSTYRAAHGAVGKYGVPTSDAKCGLLGGGCVQRFTHGTIYSSTRKSSATTTAIRGTQGEVVAAARSLVGYHVAFDGRNNRSLVNTWMGNTGPWCGYFQSWAAAASGNSSVLAKYTSFASLRSHARSTIKHGSTPRTGSLAFFTFPHSGGEVTHVGLVVSWTASSVRVIDGNTTWNGKFPAGHRGVAERSFPRSYVSFFAYPAY